MMIRSQVTLDSELRSLARKRASELGVSFAEYIRRLVVRDLDRPRPKGDVTQIFDLGRSAGSDIRRDKDKLIGKAVEADYQRSLRR